MAEAARFGDWTGDDEQPIDDFQWRVTSNGAPGAEHRTVLVFGKPDGNREAFALTSDTARLIADELNAHATTRDLGLEI